LPAQGPNIPHIDFLAVHVTAEPVEHRVCIDSRTSPFKLTPQHLVDQEIDDVAVVQRTL